MANQYVNDFNDCVKAYYKDLKKYKPIPRKEEEELIALAKNGDIESRNKIIESNLRFVVEVAKKYKGRGVSFGDLISDGNMGLIKAIDKFDADKGVKFISYAVWWIRQAILEDIDASKDSQVFEPIGDECNEKDIEDANDTPNEDVITFTSYEVYDDSDASSNMFMDEKMLSDILSSLSDKERMIIERYYGINGNKEETTVDIGKDFGVSGERIRHIKAKAMRKMRSAVMASEYFFG